MPHRDCVRSIPRSQLPRIKGMEWLAHMEHDVVGRIDDIVDGTLSNCLETVAEPRGRRTHLYPADVCGDVAGRERGTLQRDRDAVRKRFEPRFNAQWIRNEREFQNRREFLGDTAVRQTIVSSVRRHLYIEYVVFHTFYFEYMEGERVRESLRLR